MEARLVDAMLGPSLCEKREPSIRTCCSVVEVGPVSQRPAVLRGGASDPPQTGSIAASTTSQPSERSHRATPAPMA